MVDPAEAVSVLAASGFVVTAAAVLVSTPLDVAAPAVPLFLVLAVPLALYAHRS